MPRKVFSVANIFPVPKKDGGWRPLHALNTFIPQEHFKMEDLVTTEEWLTKIGCLLNCCGVPVHSTPQIHKAAETSDGSCPFRGSEGDDLHQ